MQYGYIGLGVMGAAMVRHLCATGHEVLVFDVDPAPVDAAVEHGATPAVSAAEAARRSDIVSICVSDTPHVEAVLTGPDGIEQGSHDGLVVLVHSTVHPDTMRWARETAAPWGVRVHDVCVAGGWFAAETGDLTLFVGDTEHLTPDARALLDVYGSRVIDGGPIGGGAALKIGNNVMTYAQLAAVRCAHDLVTTAGADPSALADAWRHMGALTMTVDVFLGAMRADDEPLDDDAVAFVTPLAATAEKDLDLALAMTRPGAAHPTIVTLRDDMRRIYGLTEQDRHG